MIRKGGGKRRKGIKTKNIGMEDKKRKWTSTSMEQYTPLIII